jgi:hypothetical protein
MTAMRRYWPKGLLDNCGQQPQFPLMAGSPLLDRHVADDPSVLRALAPLLKHGEASAR